MERGASCRAHALWSAEVAAAGAAAQAAGSETLWEVEEPLTCPLPQCGGDTAEDPGGALTSHVGLRCHGETSPGRVQGDGPEVPVEGLPCCGETLTATTKRLQQMSDIDKPPQEISDTDELPAVALPVVPDREPFPETQKGPSRIKLPPWLGKWGTSPEKDSSTALPALPPTPPTPAEKPSQSVPQRSRVTRDWQKEIIVDPLDSRLGEDFGSENFQRGYHGLPIHQFLSSLTDSSSLKDCPPLRVLLGQGQRKATLASMLYEKYRQAFTPAKETEEEISPPPRRMESISTTHNDYRAMGFHSTPQPTTQPHNYLTEEPTSFWLEQARGLPGVTPFFGRSIPFKRNAAFSTPITLHLGHPEPFNLCDPYDPLSSQLQPHKQ